MSKCDIVDTLSLQGMLQYLPQSVQSEVSDKICIYECLETTNNTAKELASSGAEHGTVVIANHQTAGKGRFGKSFHSPPDHGVYMSIVLFTSRLSFSTPTLITASAAVSVCEAIENISDKTAQIKWVNDIFLDGKKVCGILTESVSSSVSTGSQVVVLGIGVNFSTPAENFPKELQTTAGSVFCTEKPSATRNRLVAEVIYRIVFPKKQHDEKEMLEKYRKRMFLLGKTVRITCSGEPYEALAVDIDEIGQLIVKKANGDILSLSSGEVSLRESPGTPDNHAPED